MRAQAASTRAIILPMLESEPDDEDFLALAPRPVQAIALEAPPPPGMMPGRSPGQTMRWRTMLAMAGGLGVVILLAGLMLFDRYHDHQGVAGWSAAPRHEATPNAISALVEKAPAAAGPSKVSAAVPASAAAAFPATALAPVASVPAAAPPAAAPSTPWACTEGVAALGLCELAPAAARR